MTPFGIALIARGQAPAITGTLTVTEDEETLAASGTAYTSITGTVAITEEEETVAASGAVGLVVGNAQNATVAAAGTTGITVTKPTDVITGDVMYAFISRSTFANNAAWTCSGWTDIGPVAASAGSTVGNDRQMTMLRKVVTDGAGEAANYTFVNTQSTTYQIVGIIVNVHGASTTTPEDAAIPAYNFNSDDATPASRNVTSTTAGALVIQFCQLSLGTTGVVTPGAPSTYTLVTNGNAAETAGGVTDNQCVTAYKFLGAASSTAGTNVWTHTPDDATTETLIACVAVRDVIQTPTVTGTVAITEDEETVAASGTAHESITGTVAVTEGEDTCAADGGPTTMAFLLESGDDLLLESGDKLLLESDTGVVSVTGTVAVTEEDDSLAASGTAYTSITGTLAVTEEEETVAASGTAYTSITGTVAVTEEDDSLAASGTFTITGTVNVTEDDDTLAGAGDAALVGTAGVSEDDDTVVGSGTSTTDRWPKRSRIITVLPAPRRRPGQRAFITLGITGQSNIVGIGNTTEPDDTLAASGLAALVGTAAVSEDEDATTAAGTHAASGAAALTEEEDTLDAAGTSGTAQVTGTASLTEDDDSGEAAANSGASGSLVLTEEHDSLSAHGPGMGLVLVMRSVAVPGILDPPRVRIWGLRQRHAFTTVPTGTVNVTDELDTVAASGTASASPGSGYTYTFTGANGATWSADWATSNNGAGGTIDIQSNQGRMLTTATSFNTQQAVLSASQWNQADGEALVEFTASTAFGREILVLRGSGAWSGDSQAATNGYYVELDDNLSRIRFYKSVSSVVTQIGTNQSFTFGNGVTYRVRFRVEGSAIKVRVWDLAGAEPGAWTYEQTDTSITAAGRFMLAFRQTNAGITEVRWDNLAVSPTGVTAVSGTASLVDEDDATTTDGLVAIGGSAPVTEQDDATTATGSSVVGTLARTLGTINIAASGGSTIGGTVARTLANVVPQAAGALGVSGTLAKTLGNVTSSAFGAAANVAGTIVETLDSVETGAPLTDEFVDALVDEAGNVIRDEAGNVIRDESGADPVITDELGVPIYVRGAEGLHGAGSALAVTLANLTATAVANAGTTGTGTTTTGNVTSAATAVSGAAATLAETLDPLTGLAAGSQTVPGSLTKTLDQLTSTSAGSVTIGGSAAVAEEEDSLAGAGTSTPTGAAGSASLTEDDDTLVAAGDSGAAGIVAQALADVVSAGGGSSTAGEIVETLDALVSAITGTAGPVSVDGAAAIILAGITSAAEGHPTVIGGLARGLAAVVGDAVGSSVSGVLAELLDPLTSITSGSVTLTVYGVGKIESVYQTGRIDSIYDTGRIDSVAGSRS